MSRSNYDKPFYVDVGTSVVAIRCASNHDVVFSRDHIRSPFSIKLMEDACDRMNKEFELSVAKSTTTTGNAAAMREALLLLTEKVEYYLQMGLIQLPLPIEEANTKAKHALSAPPRNCDRFGGDEGKLFDSYIQDRKFCKYKDLFPDYGFWLLKTAKTNC